jgi:hypothetical protein
LSDLVVGSSDLEDAYGLEAFELQVDLAIESLRERWRFHEWGFSCHSFDSLAGGDNIVERWQLALVHEVCQIRSPFLGVKGALRVESRPFSALISVLGRL